MPRPRGQDVAQKPVARGMSKLRTSSDLDPLSRFVKEGSPRLGDRRSPKGSQSDPMNQKKLGTRIADLESQLEQTQVELKNLKGQLASAEAAEREVQEKSVRKAKKPEAVKNAAIPEKPHNKEIQEAYAKDETLNEVINEHQWETDVFEVPNIEMSATPLQEAEVLPLETKPVDEPTHPQEISEPVKISSPDLVMKDEEISCLKAMLERKDKEIKGCSEEIEKISKQLAEAKSDISLAETKGAELATKLTILCEELQESKSHVTILTEKLYSVEQAKAALESEMNQLRVQTEQWRKAADAAAAVLAGEVDMNCGRTSGRFGSMDKLESPAGVRYAGFVGSPGFGDEMGDGLGSGGKRRGAGIRMFGDLWRKKGHK
uniref:Uncharacterized protein n=1 Tax=Kalanchoe fedtschenkoi TaxID=63787 RepID=A0A7N0ZV10_KALFE